jgi:hypothetical protein
MGECFVLKSKTSWWVPPFHHNVLAFMVYVATPLLEECKDDIHTPEMGTWESFETPKISEFDFRG